ncbi:MAG TPA: hypothetical protein VKT70_13865 [Stellaceae bacterium]|nr:hypothetical protein [Stellaceae bacterium]
MKEAFTWFWDNAVTLSVILTPVVGVALLSLHRTFASREDIARILVALERQNGERRAMAEKIEGVEAQLRQIEKSTELITQFLLHVGAP